MKAEKDAIRPTRRISQNSLICRVTPETAGTKPSLPLHSARACRSADTAEVSSEEIAGPAMPMPGQPPMPSAST